MKTPFFRTPYNYDTNEASDESALACKDKSLAQQHFRDECDINVLFGKYLETGVIPQVMDQGLAYQDFEGVFDYQSAMNAVVAAKASFDQLPARIKNRFDNDPNKLLHFLNNPENRDEAEFLGLVNPKTAGQPQGHALPTGQPGPAQPVSPGPNPQSDPGRGSTPAAPQQTAPLLNRQ